MSLLRMRENFETFSRIILHKLWIECVLRRFIFCSHSFWSVHRYPRIRNINKPLRCLLTLQLCGNLFEWRPMTVSSQPSAHRRHIEYDILQNRQHHEWRQQELHSITHGRQLAHNSKSVNWLANPIGRCLFMLWSRQQQKKICENN